MPLPLLAAAIPGAAMGLYKGISGMIQTANGKKMAKNNIRPVYARPNEITQSQNLAERNYLNGMPGSTAALDTIGAASANAFGNATQGASSSGDVLDAATKINNNENNAINQLATQQTADQQQSQAAYQSALNTSAGYADKEFSYNKDDPYQKTAAAASAMIGAGNQNTFNGLDDIAGLASTVIANGKGQSKPEPETGVGGITPATTAAAAPSAWSSGQMQKVPSSLQTPNMMGKMVWDKTTGKFREKFM